jgi:hypothetical protein
MFTKKKDPQMISASAVSVVVNLRLAEQIDTIELLGIESIASRLYQNSKIRLLHQMVITIKPSLAQIA